MARKGSPYGPAHQRARRQLLARPRLCVHCWAEQATVADHDPPLSLHAHREGSGCCRYQPSCATCSAKQGKALQGAATARLAPVDGPGPFIEPAGIDEGDPVWQVPWLAELLDVPDDATWPRFMTAPHPGAVGTYGPEVAAWAQEQLGEGLWWWQRLVAYRLLEYDADGRLLWLTALATAARQVGKSTLLRALAGWRLQAADRFDEPQTVLHVSRDLGATRHVIAPAMAWAEARDEEFTVRRQNGHDAIRETATGSQWLVRSERGVYGYSASLGLVDEAWDVDAAAVDDGIRPTQLQRHSPQLLITSTAHRKATSLFVHRRLMALGELRDPRRTLIIEWSAPRGADIGDELWQRMASPHWGPTRAELIDDDLRRVRAGKSIDPDETDPEASFRGQYLNEWPTVAASTIGEPLLADGAWDAAFEDIDIDGPIVFAVEDWMGAGAAAAYAATVPDSDRIVVGGYVFDTRAKAYTWARWRAQEHPISVLLIGATLADDIELADFPAVIETRSTNDLRSALSLMRELFTDDRIVQDGQGGETGLREQMTNARVKSATGGGLALVNAGRFDAVKAAAWAVAEAHRDTALVTMCYGGPL